MNSLVVLLSVMALVSAKPGFYDSGVVSYAGPAIAIAPAAVSHQSRVDIKSSPAVVAAKVIAPVSRSVVAEQAVAYAAPAVYAAPIVAPAAVSSQSRVDIKSSPAIVSSVAVAPVAYSAPSAAQVAYGASIVAPLPYGASIAAPIAYGASIATPVAYGASIATPVAYGASIAAPIPYGASIAAPVAYSAPLASYSSFITPAIPAVSAVDKPEVAALPVALSETPEVAAARAAHLEAKALEESHKVQKRSLHFVSAQPQVSLYVASPASYAVPSVVHPSLSHVASFARTAPTYSGAVSIYPY